MIWTEKERETWRGRPRPAIAEWAQARVRLTTKMGAQPGPYEPDLTPWVYDIFAAAEDPEIEGIVLVKAAQIGGSLTVQIIIAWVIDCEPANVINFMDTDTNAKHASTHRIQPIIDGDPELAARVEAPHKRNKLEVNFEGGVLSLAGANSISQLGSKSAPWVIRDETGKWREKLGAEAGALEAAGERVEGQYFFKLIDLSTPVLVGDPILKQYEISDQGHYEVPCPTCGAYQELIWAQMRWPHDPVSGKSVEPAVARESTWYECRHCGGQIFDADKRWLLDHCHRVRKGETIEITRKAPPADQVGHICRRSAWQVTGYDGTVRSYRITGTPPAGRRAGFKISRLYSIFRSWGALVERWLQIGNDLSQRQIFINSTLAEPWRQKTYKPEVETLTGHIWRHQRRGTVPAGYELITAGADVQADFIRWSAWAWRLDGARHLIDYGELAEIEQLAAITGGMTWPAAEGGRLGVVMLFVDRRYRSPEVDAFSRGRRNVVCCQGLETPTVSRRGPVSLSLISEDGRGHKLPQRLQVQVASVYVSIFKDELHDRLATIEPRFDLTERPAAAVTFCELVEPAFLEELTSEERVARTDRRGREVTEWVQIRALNHYLDTSVYAGAAFYFCRPLWRPAPPKKKPTRETGRRRGRRAPIRTRYS